MQFTSARRVGVVAWPFAVAALLLASCGSDSAAGPTRSTLDLNQETTAFVVRPTTPSTTTAPAPDDGTSAVAQEYVVQAGDYPLKVADQFQVPLEDLINFNGWASANEFPFPGSTIKIPPGGVIPGGAAPAAGDGTGDATGDATGDVAGDTIPDAGDNCAEGTHTVVEGDFPLKLAEQYDVTIESLDAANAANPAYSQFVPGQTIVIPAKADC